MNIAEKHLLCWEETGKCSSPRVHKDGIYVKGYLDGEDALITGQNLVDYFRDADNLDSFTKLVERANGYFAVIIDTPTKILAAVDRVCSTHLFYSTHKRIEIGDNHNGFIGSSSHVSKEATKSFLSSGYVHGQDTLLENVYQVPAGGILTIDKSDRSTNISHYFSYLTTDKGKPDSREQLLKELHRVHLLVFERMVTSLGGRQVVVPLSGGYDSRLIIEMLAHFGHRNVLCVTWGDEKYWQVQIARETAKAMGMDWLRFENTREQWNEWCSSGGFERSMAAAGAIATVPYIQENILVKTLKDEKRIAQDAIFISGNTGDFVEGAHVNRMYSYDDVDELCGSIASIHMRQNKLRNPDDVTSVIKREILAFRDIHGEINGFDEYWEWRERQSKFVTKCVKVFEEDGFEWRMPFWDLEVMNFWTSVPREMKLNRALFYDYATEYMSSRPPKANPSIPFIRRYADALADGRYGCFKPRSSAFSNIFSSSKQVSEIDLVDLITHRSIAVTRINGLSALGVMRRVGRKIHLA